MIIDYFNNLLQTIDNFQYLGYWFVFLSSFLESIVLVGLAIPGVVIMILVGFLSAEGIFDLGDMILLATIGAILGDLTSYFLGVHFKRFFDDGNKFLNSSYLERGKDFFNLHGGKSILIGRFVGPMRTIISFIAGLSRMDFERFILWDISSSLLWATTFLYLGFISDQAWQTIALWSERMIILTAVVIFSFIFYVLRKRIIKEMRYFFKFTFVSLVFIFSVFILVFENLSKDGVVFATDKRFIDFILVIRDAELTNLFYFVTTFGDWEVVSLFVLAVSSIFWLLNKKTYIIPMIITFIGSGIFTEFFKIVVHRARPSIAMYTENSLSFPSGHATVAMVFYGFLTYILVKSSDKSIVRANIFLLGALVVLFIGFSRLYLGVHYASDVLGGYLIGAFWLVIGIFISEYLLHRKIIVSQ